MIGAAKTKMINTRLSGCYFHLRQAVERQTQIKGIKKRSNENPDLRLAINKFYALCFIPVEYLEEVVKNYIKPMFDKTLPQEAKVQTFFTYLCSTYLHEIKGM